MAACMSNYNDEFIVRDYRENKPLSYIRNKYKVSESYIYRVLRDNNIKPSRAKTTIEKMDNKDISNLLEAIKEYYHCPNKSIEEIAKKYKIKLSAFRYLFQKNDILPNRYNIEENLYKLVIKIMEDAGITYNQAVDKCLGNPELTLIDKYKLLLTKVHNGSCRERFEMEPSKLFNVIKLRLVCYPPNCICKECTISNTTMERIVRLADINLIKQQKMFRYGLYKNLDNREIYKRVTASSDDFEKCYEGISSILKLFNRIEIAKPELNFILDKYINEGYKLSILSKYIKISEFQIFVALEQFGVKFINDTPLELGDFMLRHKLEIEKYIDIKLDELAKSIKVSTECNISQTELSKLFNVPREQITKWQNLDIGK
jgi:transposase